MAGYTHNLSSDIDIEPAVLVKSDGAATIFDINVRGVYKDMVWLGLTFRMDDAISPMAGFNYNFPDNRNSVKIGYSYDLTTSEIKNHKTQTRRPPRVPRRCQPRCQAPSCFARMRRG